MAYIYLPTRDDFLLLGHDTERWLDTVQERRGPVDGMGGKVRCYRQIAGFIAEPKRYIRGLEVFGGFGGFILHSSLSVTDLVATADNVVTLKWNHSGGCEVQSSISQNPQVFCEFDTLSDDAKTDLYMKLSTALGRVVLLTKPIPLLAAH